MHRGFDTAVKTLVQEPIGTGPFELTRLEVGTRASVRKRPDGSWWGGSVHLDGIDWIDYGVETAATIAAFESGEIDLTAQTRSYDVAIPDGMGAKSRRSSLPPPPSSAATQRQVL